MNEGANVAIVVIGRNEGQRLLCCLASVVRPDRLVVYVDSGSTDGSEAAARAMLAQVIELDMSTPFTAARARNAGWRAAMAMPRDIEWIQFVDGDCEVHPDWVSYAVGYLREHPQAAAVFGQQSERYPLRSIYNQLCAIEWRVAPGSVKTFAGCVLVRASALTDAGGYREDLIAGEEPELCVRLRQRGWEIHSVALPMTSHDAAMTRFDQWWKRARRAGYAFASGAYLHGAPPERHGVRESLSIWLWGAVIPAAVLLSTIWLGPAGLLGALIYPLQALRLWWSSSGAQRERVLQAAFLLLGKFPALLGQLQFLRDRWHGRQSQLIEYK